MRLVQCVLCSQAIFQCLLHRQKSFLIALGTQDAIFHLILKLWRLNSIGLFFLLSSRVKFCVDFWLSIPLFIILLLCELINSFLPLVKLPALFHHRVKALPVPFGVVLLEVVPCLLIEIVHVAILILLIVPVEELCTTLFSC